MSDVLRRFGKVAVRLQSSLYRVQGILGAVSIAFSTLCPLQSIVRTATNVETRLLELAAISVLYFLVHRFACSLRRTALETSVRSFGRFGMCCICGLLSPCWGMLAIASCGRPMSSYGNRDVASCRASSIKATSLSSWRWVVGRCDWCRDEGVMEGGRAADNGSQLACTSGLGAR